MTAPTRYRERLAMDEQPPCEVEVMSPTTWGGVQGQPDFHVVRYPDGTGILACRLAEAAVRDALDVLVAEAGLDSDVITKIAAALFTRIPGREYIIDNETLERHFELVLPQTFRVQAWGGVFERPHKKQRELDEQLDGGTDGKSADSSPAGEELPETERQL
jgi:hypothetical protein